VLRRGALAVAVALVAGACSYETTDLTPVAPVNSASSVITAADGTVLTVLDAGQYRLEVGFDEIPGHVVDAVIAIEDRRFWDHNGIDLKAMLRAARANVEAGGVVEGASTITQQYVKNAFLDRDRTLDRKLEEASLAIQLEREHSKEEILTYYLNTVYLGAGAYGLGAAAQRYFGKGVTDLTVEEGALLAGLIRTPSNDDPFVDLDAALVRRGEVLEAMVGEGYIDERTRSRAHAQPIHLAPPPAEQLSAAPHFVEAVKRWVLDRAEFGATRAERSRALYTGGLVIETTLDLTRQAQAVEAVGRVLPAPTDPEAAVVVVEPATGEVQALVGGPPLDSGSPSAWFDLATQGHRPAGSAFKPFVLASALEQGVPLATAYDAPAHLELAVPGGTWTVDNYDGVEGGRVDLVDATVFSLNTAYAQLVGEVGAADVVATATRMGIESPLEPVASIALGSQPVTPIEMATAYSTLANDGRRVDAALVRRVTDRDGTVLYEHRPTPTEAISPATARSVTHVLRQVVERGTGHRARIGRPVAGKTGTGQTWADAWFAGYTPDLVAVVWVGFPDGQVPMVPPTTRQTVVGGSWPADIWQLLMTAALAQTPATEFAAPPDQAPGEEMPTGFGPEIPDVLGFPGEVATAALGRSGFVVEVVEVPDDQFPRGVVVGTDPPAGQRHPGGTTVTVRVANGQPVLRVPAVLDMAWPEAVALLRRAGYTVDVRAEPDPDDDLAVTRAGLPWRQEPSSGTPAVAGSTVTIWVNPAPDG
jgi:penicillin-binding protein 1A